MTFNERLKEMEQRGEVKSLFDWIRDADPFVSECAGCRIASEGLLGFDEVVHRAGCVMDLKWQ